MPTPALQLESLTRVTPLAVRFWDEVTQSTIGDDSLEVVTYPSDLPQRRTRAIVNHTRTFIFPDLPGLREQEFGAGDKDYWKKPPPQSQFTIEVQDKANRFLPFSFEVSAPTRDVIEWHCPPKISVANPPGTVPLFSTPARIMPSTLATIRIELHSDQIDNLTHDYPPASWAMIEASFKNSLLARSLADDRGRAILIFPYPDLPAAVPGKSLADQMWAIKLRAYYQPIADAAPGPNLCTALRQPLTQLWSKLSSEDKVTHVLSPPIELAEQEIAFGQPLVVKGIDSSIVWITPI
jgi:hypothetical protein